MSCLFNAVCCDDLDSVREKLFGAEADSSLFFHACSGEMVKFLVFMGLDPNTHDMNGWTPLHQACNAKLACVVRALVESGASVNARTNKNMLAIDVSALVSIDKYLIEQGSNMGRIMAYGMQMRAFCAQILWNVMFA